MELHPAETLSCNLPQFLTLYFAFSCPFCWLVVNYSVIFRGYFLVLSKFKCQMSDLLIHNLQIIKKIKKVIKNFEATGNFEIV